MVQAASCKLAWKPDVALYFLNVVVTGLYANQVLQVPPFMIRLLHGMQHHFASQTRTFVVTVQPLKQHPALYQLTAFLARHVVSQVSVYALVMYCWKLVSR
jgi:hypothetical protein